MNGHACGYGGATAFPKNDPRITSAVPQFNPRGHSETTTMAEQQTDPLKEKFRPDDSALDKEVDAALGGVSIEDLLGFDNRGPGPAAAADSPGTAGAEIPKG